MRSAGTEEIPAEFLICVVPPSEPFEKNLLRTPAAVF
jgi:hypothetical protein